MATTTPYLLIDTRTLSTRAAGPINWRDVVDLSHVRKGADANADVFLPAAESRQNWLRFVQRRIGLRRARQDAAEARQYAASDGATVHGLYVLLRRLGYKSAHAFDCGLFKDTVLADGLIAGDDMPITTYREVAAQ